MDLEQFASAYTKVTGKIPAALKSIFEPLPFWENDFHTLIRFIYSENGSLGIKEEVWNFASMSEMTIRADEQAFYIDGESVFRWTDDHVEKDGKFFYQNKSGVKFVFGVEHILCVLNDKYQGLIVAKEEGVQSYFESTADKAEIKKLSLYYIVSSILKDSPIWEKWGPVYGVTKLLLLDESQMPGIEEIKSSLKLTSNFVADQKTQLLIDDKGIWFGEDKKTYTEWKNYTIYRQEDDEIDFIKNEKIIPALQGAEQASRDLSVSSLGIVGEENYWWKSESSGDGRNLEDLDIVDYKASDVKSQNIEYNKDGKQKGAKISLAYGSNMDGTHSVQLRNTVFYFVEEDDQIVPGPLPGFDRHPLKIYYSKDKYICLEKPYYQQYGETQGYGSSHDFYKISRKNLRRIASASVVKIVLEGDKETWTIKNEDFLNLAKELESKISPEYLIDYYDAANALDDKDYQTASIKIRSAINAKPNNFYFQQLKEKIQISSVEAAEQNFQKAQTLFQEKKYEEAYEKISIAHTLSDKEEYASLYETILDALRNFFKEEFEKAKSAKRTNKYLNIANRALSIFPQEDWARSAVKESKKRHDNRLYKLIGAILLAFFLIIVLPSLFPVENSSTDKSETSALPEETSVEEPEETSVDESEEMGMLSDVPVYEELYERNYHGTIDEKYLVTVKVLYTTHGVYGSYYYDKNGADRQLKLDGYFENHGNDLWMVLKEYNKDGKQMGTFYASKYTEDHTIISGTYILESNGKEMPFELSTNETQSDSSSSYGYAAGERVLSESELEAFSKEELRILRNEVYARHGHIFKSEDLTSYFSRFDWYHPDTNDAFDRLSEMEKNNILTIKSVESSAPSRDLDLASEIVCIK